MALPAFAAVLPTILSTLEKWSEWSRIKGAPDRVDALEQRIAALEAGTGGTPSSPAIAAKPAKAPGRACPACGEYAQRRTEVCLDNTRVDTPGARLETWMCGECGVIDEVEVPPRR